MSKTAMTSEITARRTPAIRTNGWLPHVDRERDRRNSDGLAVSAVPTVASTQTLLRAVPTPTSTDISNWETLPAIRELLREVAIPQEAAVLKGMSDEATAATRSDAAKESHSCHHKSMFGDWAASRATGHLANGAS